MEITSLWQILANSIRCRVATRVRGEQGGTTGALDREVDEERGEREKEGETRSHTHRHGRAQRTQQTWDDQKTEYTNANVCTYIDIKKRLQLTGRHSEYRRVLTHTHTQKEQRDGDSAGSTRVFRGAESASQSLRRKRLWKITEEKSSVPVRQHFVLSDAR